MKKALVIILALASGCGFPSKKSEPHWGSSMRELSNVLSDLLNKSAQIAPESPLEEKLALRRDIDRLSRITHDINKTEAVPTNDKSIKIVSREFQSEAILISKLMADERWPQAQARTYNLTRYCISCHTLNVAGSSEFTVQFKPPISGLSHYQKAQYYTAIRQYESAIISYEKALTDKEWAKSNPKDWDKGVMALLSILIHVKKNPNLTLEMLSQLFDTNAYPAQLKPAARIWRQQVVEWDKQRSEKLSLDTVEKWFNTATKEKKPEHAGVFLLLRASSQLHELLGDSITDKNDEQRALYLTGQVSAALGELNFIYFPDQYFETCIQIQATSKYGRLCSRKLAQSKN